MKKYLLILTLLIAGSFSGFAQEDETDPRMGKLQEKMQQYIQKRLNMTKNEAEKFSPIFIRYITELRKVHQENRADKVTLQLKAAEVRVKFRDEFRQVMDDKRAIIIQQIKDVITEMVYHSDELPAINFSDLLSTKLLSDYTVLAHLFSEVQGTTIEQFIISHNIERIKELLLYDELNLTQISYKMNYSSVAHLSNQFKKVTGFSPSYYKSIKENKRMQIEDV